MASTSTRRLSLEHRSQNPYRNFVVPQTKADSFDSDDNRSIMTDMTDANFLFVNPKEEMLPADQYFTARASLESRRDGINLGRGAQRVTHTIEIDSASQLSHTSVTPLMSSKANATLGVGGPRRSKSLTPLLPPTSNTLEAAERSALMKSTRKLEKMLGTTPQLLEEPSIADGGEPKKIVRRTTLVGEHPQSPLPSASRANVPTVPRVKSTKSMLATPSKPTPQPVQRAPLLRLAMVPPHSPNQSRASGDSFDKPSGLSRAHSVSSVHSLASQRSSLSATHTPHSPSSPTTAGVLGANLTRQQSRAKMAKLTRIMGENVPTDLMLAQTVRSPGPRPQASFPTRPPSARRRMSMDVTPTTRTRVDSERFILAHPASSSTMTVASTSTQRSQVSRSRSFWGNKKERDVFNKMETRSVPAPIQRSPSLSTKNLAPATKTNATSRSTDKLPPLEEVFFLTDQQKALNVKRALKMAQIFGTPPPQSLVHISSTPASAKPDNGSRDRTSKQSLASLAYMLDHDRDSLYDLLSGTPDEDVDTPLEWPYEKRASHASSLEQPQLDAPPLERRSFATSREPLTQVSPLRPRSNSFGSYDPNCPREAADSSASAALGAGLASKPSSVTKPATSPNPSSKSLSPPSVQPSKLPGKLRKETLMEKATVNSVLVPAVKDEKDPIFSNRRRRAAKLSRFFGVGYHDLFASVIQFGEGRKNSSPSHSIPASPIAATITISRTSTSRSPLDSSEDVRTTWGSSRPASPGSSGLGLTSTVRTTSRSSSLSHSSKTMHPLSRSSKGSSAYPPIFPGADGVPPLPQSPAQSPNFGTRTLPSLSRAAYEQAEQTVPETVSRSLSLRAKSKSFSKSSAAAMSKSLSRSSSVRPSPPNATIPQLPSGTTVVTVVGSGPALRTPTTGEWNPDSAHQDIQNVMTRLRNLK